MLAAAAAALVLLGLGAGLTFFSDEWAFIETRSLTDPSTWFAPHNEHWATLPILVYRLLVETVGLNSYMPYLAVLLALHLAVAGLTYELVRRTSGRWPALAVGVVTLFLGAGFENLYWAFQIGFVGALAAGLGAMLIYDARPLSGTRAVAGAGLLLASLATQGGPGLVCCVAVGMELLLDRGRRRVVPILALPAVVYAAWYLLIGRVGVESHGGLFSLGGVDDVPPMLLTGAGAVAGTIVGVGNDTGQVVAVVAVGAAIVWVTWRRRVRLAPRFIACVAAVVVLYTLIALARSFAGPNIGNLTRYTYISAILFVVGLSAQIGVPSIATLTRRRLWFAVGGAVLALSLVWNVRLLIVGRDLFIWRAERTRAFVTAALERPLPATTNPDRTLVLIPSPNSVERIVRLYGSPVDDWMVPWAVPAIRPEVLAEARQVLAEGAPIPLPR